MNSKRSPEEILERAIPLTDPAERASYMKEACRGDDALREEVESLLSAYLSADTFMDTRNDPNFRKESQDEVVASDSFPSINELREDFPELEIVEMIGRGGMGAVFKARQESLDRFVALKVLPSEWNSSENFKSRFEREAKTLAALNHPNIVTIHDFGERNGRFFFTMEFVDGTDLSRMIRSGDLEPDLALKLIPQVCDAIQFAHDRGVVHRDIKPGNILVDRDGRVKVADFGIAKLGNQREVVANQAAEEHRSPHLTAPGGVLGTPAYMAPEQAAASSALDHRSDLYALGVVFYEMLVGSPPPIGESAILPSRSGKVERRWDRVIMRALEQDPERRYQNATEIKTAVESVLAQQTNLFPRWLKLVAACAVIGGVAFLLWPKAETGKPMVNSLGMRFVPVPGVEGLVSVWETRVKDYEAFTKDTGRIWQRPPFKQTEGHPAVQVSWHDALAFCEWLTERERKRGLLKDGEKYRLPTDREWSAMGNLLNEKGAHPKDRSLGQLTIYPWGEEAPIPEKAGNFPDMQGRERFASASVQNYKDGFAATAPVGSFPANANGLHDLGGNVWEWTATEMSDEDSNPALRGGSWWAPETVDEWKTLLVSYRRGDVEPTYTAELDVGFRVVLGPEPEKKQGDGLFQLVKDGDLTAVENQVAKGTDVNVPNSSGQPPIVLAAEYGDLEMVKLLHKHGATLNSSDRRGHTALHAAAEIGNFELADWLLKNGANARARSIAGREPFLLAVQRASIQLLELLLDAAGPEALIQSDPLGATPVALACLFAPDETVEWIISRLSEEQIQGMSETELSGSLLFISERDPALISEFLKKGGKRLTPDILKGALGPAINYDKPRNFSLLLEALGEYQLDEASMDSLGLNAVMLGRPWAIKDLLARGWDIRSFEEKKDRGLLHLTRLESSEARQEIMAIAKKQSGGNLDHWALKLIEREFAKMPPPAVRETLRLLVQVGADLEFRNDTGQTPLIAAAMKGNLVAVETLLELGADIEAKDELDFTPLLCAVEQGHLAIVKELEREKADFDAVSKNGKGVLHHVHRDVEMLRYLLAKEIPVDRKCNDGSTPLVDLSSEGDEEIVAIFLEAGADVNASWSTGDHAGSTALHGASAGQRKDQQEAFDLAAKLGKPRVKARASAAPEERCRTIKLLVDAGADPNALNKNFHTPLHVAASNGQLECIKVLLNNGAIIDHPLSMTPLVCSAIDSEEPEVLTFLLEQKARIDLRSPYGAFPIHHAAYNGKVEIVRLLLDAGADPDARDFSFRTPLHNAAMMGNRDIVDLLCKRGARINAVDAANMTPSQFARQRGHSALANHLNQLSRKK